MPQILKVAPKDLYVTIEMSITELRKLREALGISRIDYDGAIEKEREAAEYAKSVFFPFLDDFLREMEHGT